MSFSADTIVPKNGGFVAINSVRYPDLPWEIVNKSYADFKTASGRPYDHTGTILGTTITATTGFVLPTNGGTATLLDYYERMTITGVALSGAVVAAAAVNLLLERIGKTVTLTWNFGSSGHLDATTETGPDSMLYIGGLNTIPTRMLPADPVYMPILFQSGTTPYVGQVMVHQGAYLAFRFCNPDPEFPHTTAFTFFNGSITYPIW